MASRWMKHPFNFNHNTKYPSLRTMKFNNNYRNTITVIWYGAIMRFSLMDDDIMRGVMLIWFLDMNACSPVQIFTASRFLIFDHISSSHSIKKMRKFGAKKALRLNMIKIAIQWRKNAISVLWFNVARSVLLL